jgi:hypothetical protein
MNYPPGTGLSTSDMPPRRTAWLVDARLVLAAIFLLALVLRMLLFTYPISGTKPFFCSKRAIGVHGHASLLH